MNYMDKDENLAKRESMYRSNVGNIEKRKQNMPFTQKHISTEHATVISSGSTMLVEDLEKIREIEVLTNSFKASYGQQEEQNLRTAANENYLNLYVGAPVEQNEKSEIARMAFKGVIKRQDKGISSTFLRMKNFPYEFTSLKNIDYKLEDFKEWEMFEQLPHFKAAKEQILEGFAKAGVTKSMFEKMTLNDFKFMLYAHCGAEKGIAATKLFPVLDEKGKPIIDLKSGKKVFTSAKQENTKQFIAEHGEKFRANLLKLPNINPKYVDALINKMETQGLTDMTCFLNKFPEWGNQPAIDVHHIINIKDCRMLEAEGKSFAEVNNYENMCFMTSGTLTEIKQKEAGIITKTPSMHFLAHVADFSFNNRSKWGNTPDAIVRLMPQKGVRSMVGLGKDLVILDKNFREKSNTQNMQKNEEKSIC